MTHYTASCGPGSQAMVLTLEYTNYKTSSPPPTGYKQYPPADTSKDTTAYTPCPYPHHPPYLIESFF